MIAEFDKENTGTITFDGFLGKASLSVASVSVVVVVVFYYIKRRCTKWANHYVIPFACDAEMLIVLLSKNAYRRCEKSTEDGPLSPSPLSLPLPLCVPLWLACARV